MRDSLGRAWKWVLIVATVMTAASFFLPFIEVRLADRPVPVSAYQIAVGLDAPRELHDTISVVKPVVAFCYSSAALLLALGAIGLARRRLGFLGGLAGIAIGLIAISSWSCEVLMERNLAADLMGRQVASYAIVLAIGGALALAASIASVVITDQQAHLTARKISVRLELGEKPVLLDVSTTGLPNAILQPRCRKSAT